MKKMTIIGAGISGLSAGINALKKGYVVTIYEKNKFAGGCATGWYKDGYYIDNCMHWLTGTNQSTKLFKEWKKLGAIDETSNLYQGEFFYKTIFQNEEITLYTDLEKTKEEMIKLSFKDLKEINYFINSVKYLAQNFQNQIIKNNHFQMLKGYQHFKKLSLKEFSEKFKHPLLKQLFIDYFPEDYSSLSLIYAYAAFVSGNGKVLTEGSKKFADNILKKYLELGGMINYDSMITKINIVGQEISSIIINDKVEIKTQNLIYAADPYYLFTKLLNGFTDHPLYKELQNQHLQTMSSFHIAFLVDKKEDILKETTIFDIDPITIGTKEIKRLVVKSYAYLYPQKEKIVYQTFTSQFSNDYHFWEKLKNESPEKYENLKNEIKEKLKKALTNKFPNLTDKIQVLDCWTPLTYNSVYNSFKGSYMGIILTPKRLFKHYSLRVKNIKNFAIASYWHKTMGGLPVALKVGKEAVKFFK